MHVEPHFLCIASHVKPHAPAAQTGVPFATIGQSAAVQQTPALMHPAPQAVCPLGHTQRWF
jgi:hypothetical protein